jgi:hypothetical protein
VRTTGVVTTDDQGFDAAVSFAVNITASFPKGEGAPKACRAGHSGTQMYANGATPG